MREHEPKSSKVDAFIDTGKLSMDATVAGLIALVPMTLVLFSGPLFGLPRVNLPMLFANIMAGDWAVGQGTVAMAWLGYAVVGALIAVSYSYIVRRTNGVSSPLTGAIHAMIPWAAIQVFLAVRLAGQTPSSTWFVPQAIVMLLGFLAHGATMGALLRWEIKRHAIPLVQPLEA